MNQLDFHGELVHLAGSLDYCELANKALNRANDLCSLDKALVKKVSGIIGEILDDNIDKIAECDLHSLQKLQSLVHEGVKLANQQHDPKPSKLEKKIEISVQLILTENFRLPQDLGKIKLIPSFARSYIMAELINRDQVALKDLHLSKQEIIELAPYLTYLDCRGAFNYWTGKEIEDFLETCSGITHLLIQTHLDIKLPSLPDCKHIDCRGSRKLRIDNDELSFDKKILYNGCRYIKKLYVREYKKWCQIYTPICQKHGIKPNDFESFMKFKLCDFKHFKDRINGKLNETPPIIEAIKNEEIAIVKVLKELGADIYKCDDQGMSSLDWACLYPDDNFDVIKLLCDENTVNQYNQNGSLCFITAAIQENQKNKFEVLKLLKELGADVNQCDSDGWSPLMWAIADNDSDLAAFLITLGADQEYANEATRLIFFSHVWGISGTSVVVDKDGIPHDVELEGCQTAYMMKMLSDYANKFFQEDNMVDSKWNTLITESDKKEILESIATGFPLLTEKHDVIINKINSGKPFVILGGTSIHAVSILIHKGQLSVFNRGLGRSVNAVENYVLPSEKLTSKLIGDLTKKHEDMESFNNMISDLQLSRSPGLMKKNQKLGNCAWVGAKGTFEGLCRIYTNEKKIYKKFIAFALLEILNDYLHNSKQMSDEMRSKITLKFFNKSSLPTLSSKYLEILPMMQDLKNLDTQRELQN